MEGEAPKFLNSLQEENRYLLNIGCVGKQVYYILRIKSYDWLYTKKNKLT